MHCDCCDKLLNDAEATARFVESNNFVNMCSECRGYLPKDVKWKTRDDLERKAREDNDAEISDPFNLMDYNDEDESW